jgi:hypothetical protein
MHLIEQVRILAADVQARSGLWGDVKFAMRVFITLPILLIAAFIGFLNITSVRVRRTARSRETAFRKNLP